MMEYYGTYHLGGKNTPGSECTARGIFGEYGDALLLVGYLTAHSDRRVSYVGASISRFYGLTRKSQ